MSSASSVSDALEGYIAGRLSADRVVVVVAAAYYGEGGRGKREGLKALMEIIERAHPGVIELSGTPDRPGFAVRLAERPFPKRYEAEFRQAIHAVLVGGYVDTLPPSPVPRPRLLARLVRAVRRLFTAST